MDDILQAVRNENALLRETLRQSRRELEGAHRHQVTQEWIRRMVFQLRDSPVKAPAWTIRKWPHTAHDQLVPVLALGDVHFGEVVQARQINGVNRYNTLVATERLRRFVEKAVHLCKRHIGARYDGAVLALLGDMFSGEIHAELGATNETTVPQALLELTETLAWVIGTLANEFGRLHVVAVAGNHGRLDEKPRAKDAVLRNWDWLLYNMCERTLRQRKTITWQVGESLDARFEVCGTKFLVTHGDKFKGGGGIQGALSPWSIGDYRLRRRQRAMRQDYDYLLFGHWHQLAHVGGIIANGSVVGYNEYALARNLAYEPPQQQLFMVRADGRIAYWLPLFLDDHGKTTKGA